MQFEVRSIRGCTGIEEAPVPSVVLDTLPHIASAAVAASIGFGLLWRRQVRTRNATSVDAAWSAAIGVCGLAFALLGTGDPVARLLAGALAVGWSARLTTHLVRDRVLGHTEEDGRYRAMRSHWGARADAKFFWFYQAQAVVAVLFAAPFVWIASQPGAVNGTQWLGVAIAAVAQIAEANADRQLAEHRADPAQRGHTCRRGLWRWSRHPNYFFEWLTWCGIAIAAAPAAGWLAAVQPAVMFVLVRFVSGVPFAERQALKSRGDDYRRYQRETNAFFPWLQRRIASDRP